MLQFDVRNPEYLSVVKNAIESAIESIIKEEVKEAVKKVESKVSAMMPRIETAIYTDMMRSDSIASDINIIVKMIIDEKKKTL